jgi:hypothetical protein
MGRLDLAQKPSCSRATGVRRKQQHRRSCVQALIGDPVLERTMQIVAPCLLVAAER